jgi:hypothetical protein
MGGCSDRCLDKSNFPEQLQSGTSQRMHNNIKNLRCMPASPLDITVKSPAVVKRSGTPVW